MITETTPIIPPIPEAELEEMRATIHALPDLPAENLDAIADVLAEIRVHGPLT